MIKEILILNMGGKVKGGLKSIPKISNEEKVINLLTEQNSDLSTIKDILKFFLVLTVLSITASILAGMFVSS